MMYRYGYLVGTFALFCILIAFDSITNAQTQCNDSTGKVQRDDYFVPRIQTRMYYSVYLPPCYDNTTIDYPVVYLMHGSNEDDHQWLRLGLAEMLDAKISNGEMAPVIVIMPFGNWIANENQFGDNSWASIFLRDLMPLVEGEYRVRGVRDYRAIGGISRGGFWAFQIALKNPA
jgi:enterochelin esterase-like enzyme